MKTVEATPDLVPGLLDRMGPEMVEAAQRYVPRNLADQITDNIARSTLSWCGLDGEGVVNMGGVIPCADGTGYVWQCAVPDAMKANKRAYLLQGRDMMRRGLAQFARLQTIVRAEYTAALRHCERHGWKIGEPMKTADGLTVCVCERTR
jgi:hypothetical protein